MEIKMEKNKLANRNNPTKMDGYDPIALTRATERVVVRGNKRKYARLDFMVVLHQPKRLGAT
jgi:hypothetical protein